MSDENKALTVLANAGMTPAESVNETELAWEEIDRLFSGRPQPVKFAVIGDTVTGRIVRGYTRQKTKFGTGEPQWWDDGSPKLEAVLEILTADGVRSLYVSSWRLQNALGQAFQEAGVRGPRLGGNLIVRYTADEVVAGGANPAKVYEAGYDPPAGDDQERRSTGGTYPSPVLAGRPAGQDESPPF